jgi:bifunctional non-homologous end joining protein LigD
VAALCGSVRGVLTPLTSACWFSPRVGAAKKLRVKSVLLDGEAVIYREDGAADFDKLHSRCFESDVVLYAFDLIELNGSDLSKRPLDERKKVLAQLLKRPLRNNAE